MKNTFILYLLFVLQCIFAIRSTARDGGRVVNLESKLGAISNLTDMEQMICDVPDVSVSRFKKISQLSPNIDGGFSGEIGNNLAFLLRRVEDPTQDPPRTEQTQSRRRLDQVLRCINEDNESIRKKFLSAAFQEQSREAIEERMTIVSEIRDGFPSLAVSKILKFDEHHIFAHCKSNNGSVIEIYLATEAKEPYLITEIELETVKVVAASRGAYLDVTDVPQGQLGDCVSKLFKAYNSGDAGVVKQFLKTNSSLEGDDLLAAVEKFAGVYREVGGLKFHSIRKYSEPESNKATVIIAKANLSNSWKAVVVDFDSDERIERVRFAPAREPSQFKNEKPLSPVQAQVLIGQYLDELQSTNKFSGSILVAVDEDILVHRAMGLASRRFQVSNKTDTRFNLASMNKMFTGIAICQLAEAGKLSLDGSVGQYLSPEWLPQELADTIKVRHLLTHTSGIGSYIEDAWNSPNADSLDNLSDYKSVFENERFNYFRPGSNYRYSNTGMFLLGVVIEQVSGESYYDYVRKNIFLPAKMSQSGFFSIQSPTPNLAIGYYERRGEIINNNRSINRGGPAGGGYSTTGDLFRFSRSLTQNRLLGRKMTQLATSAKPSWNAPNYGFGVQVRPESSIEIYGHSGGSEGVSTRLDIIPSLGTTIIVLSNIDYEAENVAKKLRQILMRIEK